MQYMLLIYDDETTFQRMSEAELGAFMQGYGTFSQEIRDSGQFVAGAPLEPVSTAASVRVQDGQQVVTDGPFAETKEQLGGYYLVEVADRDEALALAARIPSARTGTVEVRPVRAM